MKLFPLPLVAATITTINVDPTTDKLTDVLKSISDGAETIINLLPGTHIIDEPLPLVSGLTLTGSTATSSSSVISGGESVTLTKCPGSDFPNLYCSKISNLAANPRHLYVNGRRAGRGWIEDATPFSSPVSVDNEKYVVEAAAIESWDLDNVNNIEFVYTRQGSPWTESRCTVASVNLNGGGDGNVEVIMANPCFTVLQRKPCGQETSTPAFIENTGASALSAGDWFFNEHDATIMYYPLEDEKELTISGVMPVLDYLVNALNLVDVSFSNLSFEHATYRRVNSDLGYVEQQSGGLDDENSNCDDTGTWYAMPSNVRFEQSSNIMFANCVFQRLGAGGLEFTNGTNSSGVTGSLFTDISGAAVQIGGYQDNEETDSSKWTKKISVTNNIIRNVATELHGNAGISAGYVSQLTVERNTISDLTYSGISIGWGWSRANFTYAGKNVMKRNKIHDYKMQKPIPSAALGDGGGIYFLGPQMDSVCEENWLYNMNEAGGGGAIYPDEGSAHWRFKNNVVGNATFCIDDCEWLHLWVPSIFNITVDSTWVDTDTFEDNGTNTSVTRTVNIVKENGGVWPEEAQAIMDAAGADWSM